MDYGAARRCASRGRRMFDSQPYCGDGSRASISTTLLARVRLRDADAWRRFVHLYGPVIYRWAKRSRLQASDAADVAQDVLLAVAEGIDRFHQDRPGDSFLGWLWGVTRNKIRDHFRHAAHGQGVGGEGALAELQQVAVWQEEEAEPEASALISEVAHRALQLIRDEFEPRTWGIFLRCAVGGDSAADVAADLGLSVAAVYKAKSRVLLRLRRELDGLLDH